MLTQVRVRFSHVLKAGAAGKVATLQRACALIRDQCSYRGGQTCEEAASISQMHADVAAQHNVDLLRVRLATGQHRLALVKEQQPSLPQDLRHSYHKHFATQLCASESVLK